MHGLGQVVADYVPHAIWGNPLDGTKLDQETSGMDGLWHTWHAGVAIVGYIGDSIPNLRQLVKSDASLSPLCDVGAPFVRKTQWSLDRPTSPSPPVPREIQPRGSARRSGIVPTHLHAEV
jgi:hypothetical protein